MSTVSLYQIPRYSVGTNGGPKRMVPRIHPATIYCGLRSPTVGATGIVVRVNMSPFASRLCQ